MTCEAKYSTATTANYFTTSPRMFDLVCESVFVKDLYEDNEPEPKYSVVLKAADLLRTLPIERAERAHIDPYFGEINLTWRCDSRMVRAIIRPNGSISIYRQRLDRDRVAHSEMVGADELGQSLWELFDAD